MSGALELEIQRWSRGLRGGKLVWLGGALVLTVSALLWLRGLSYYPLPLGDRIDHSDYPVLSPAGSVGRMYGAVGLFLMLVNLGYLLRRRFPHWPVGRMRLWLDAHVLTGIASGLFVAFHTAFQLRSKVAMVTTVALVVTLITGIVGRFFYALVPRVEGELGTRLRDLDGLLPGTYGVLSRGLATLTIESPENPGLLALVRMISRALDVARQRRKLVLHAVDPFYRRAHPLEQAHALPLSHEVSALAAREIHAQLGVLFLRAWRPWHRLCAITMVAGVILHVGVALFYGYAWDFGH